MFEWPIMLFVTGIMSIIHISLWQIFPEKLRNLMFANPILAFLVDLAGSGLITVFTGVASFVGLCNLGASVVFGVYALCYIQHKGIKGVAIESYKLFNWLPIFPRLMVMYTKDGKSWRE